MGNSMSDEKCVRIKSKSGYVCDYECEAVPSEARKRWYIIALIWTAIGIDISGLYLASYLSGGLSFGAAVSVTLIGSAILSILAALCGNVGFSTGFSTALLSNSIFGLWGGKLINIMLPLSLVGWFAFQLDFFGEILQKSLCYYQLFPERLSILGFGMLLMTIPAIWGVCALGTLSTFSVSLMLVLIIIGIFLAAQNQSTVVAPLTLTSSLSMGNGISYVVSIWIMAVVISPDIARYAKTRKDAILGAGIGFFVGNSIIILIALILTHLVGSSDLVEIFFSIGLGISAIVILIFAQWTTNNSNLISSALGLSVVMRSVPRPVLVTLLALAGLGLACNGMVTNFTVFLSLLGIFISPIAGVYLAEYYFLGARHIAQRIDTAKVVNVPACKVVNVPACIAWIIGSGTSLLTSPEFSGKLTLTTVPALDGVSVSIIIYVALSSIMQKRLAG
ncbi:MAG: cytosine permease [Candidatus Symbiopectobacterium sp. PLON1]|nr:cytosine permease [Candidatus Symbiopectobacterium sp. PLON1]